MMSVACRVVLLKMYDANKSSSGMSICFDILSVGREEAGGCVVKTSLKMFLTVLT